MVHSWPTDNGAQTTRIQEIVDLGGLKENDPHLKAMLVYQRQQLPVTANHVQPG
jgi:hypothetical protein